MENFFRKLITFGVGYLALIGLFHAIPTKFEIVHTHQIDKAYVNLTHTGYNLNLHHEMTWKSKYKEPIEMHIQHKNTNY